jgi:cell division protein FtsI (penicillin-binding protein 3)
MVQGQRTRKLEATFARRRHLLLVVGMCVWGAIWARAFYLQVVSRTPLSDVADRQSDRVARLAAPRGDIVDRRGRLLAIDVERESFFAYPNRETSAQLLAAKFSSILGSRPSQLAAVWEQRSDTYTTLARRCDQPTAQLVRSWNLPGVHATREFDRVYPCVQPDVTDPIGFVNDAIDGASGLELTYDRLLAGADGEGVFLADASGRRFSLDPLPVKPIRPGARLHLTLDWSCQSILAEELVAAVEKWRANSGMAILMDPHTGAILAMVDYDPNGLGRKARKNRLVSDVMEPGSTFKLVTYAGSLSDGTITLGRRFDGGNGQGSFSGRLLHDDKRHGIVTAAEAFIVSSNVATARIANLLPPGRLEFWVRRFGFGDTTGIDLPGESRGRIAAQKHSEFNIATLSIGHGVAVTPLQLATAYCAVANGGYLVRPHLLHAVETATGHVIPVHTTGRRVLAPEVACLMQKIMAGVVRGGTAKTVWDPQYPIAGKTGTAEKPDLQTHRYDKTKYMATFVGFYPADRPRVLGLVILDEPKPVHYGGYTAAPVLLNAIRRGAAGDEGDLRPEDSEFPEHLPYAGASDSQGDWARQLVAAVAPMVSVMEARAELSDNSSDPDDAPAPVSAPPSVGGDNGWNRLVGTRTRQARVEAPFVETWPDFTGKSLRDAFATMRELEAQWEVSGAGTIVCQDPPAGSPIAEDRTCRLTLR